MADQDDILLVGKGPSAVDAARHITGPVAVLNDAMNLFDGPVDICFATDVEMLEAARPHWPRVRQFVLPDGLHQHCQRANAPLPSGFPVDRVLRFPYVFHPLTARAFLNSIRARRVVLRSSATCAMSWLAYQGYRRIRMIGFDGGSGYAPGVLAGTRPGINYDGFIENQALLQLLLECELGTEFQWLSPPSSPRRRAQAEWSRKISGLFPAATPLSTS